MPVAPGAYWDLLERNTPPTKRRATHIKARTGCLTCKRRRVKCDEAKPSCGRCEKAGYRCAGYETASSVLRGTDGASSDSLELATTSGECSSKDASRRGKSALQPATLRPKPPRTGAAAVPSLVYRRVDLMRASLTPTYLDAHDVLYFERFQSQVLADLSVWCGADYWRRSILREILRDKTVQHAALAAAAMMMDIEEQQEYARLRLSPSKKPSSLPAVTAGVGRSSGRAGGETRGAADAVGINNEREALSSVSISISNTTAHGKAALRHYTRAIGLCRQSLITEGVTTSTARSSLTVTFFFAIFELVQGNVGEADRILSNGMSLLYDALAQTKPDGAPALVLDGELREIQLAFDRMSLTWGLSPYFGEQKDSHAKMLAATGGRMQHFDFPSPDASTRTKQVFWNAFSSEFGLFMMSVRCGIVVSPEHLAEIAFQRNKHLNQLHHWLPILEDLYAQDPGSSVLCTIKVFAQIAIIFLNCFLDRSDVAYDAYLPVFKDIVATYQRLIPPRGATQSQAHLRLTLEVDLFPIVTFTVSKCRDRETRALALQVFGEMTRHQALWTNSSLLAALRALADLEDKGRDASGFVPSSARYYYVNSEWDFRNRRMMALFVPVLAVPTESGDMSTVRVPISF
ncbi:hypothetical protein F5Y19DRAFT_60123 [Xylariaceae sp. FL1651]|nr:hypothetical protein F5Y19DRAFT_60123 [Xylariaceae sp. FL1651]